MSLRHWVSRAGLNPGNLSPLPQGQQSYIWMSGLALPHCFEVDQFDDASLEFRSC